MPGSDAPNTPEYWRLFYDMQVLVINHTGHTSEVNNKLAHSLALQVLESK